MIDQIVEIHQAGIGFIALIAFGHGRRHDIKIKTHRRHINGVVLRQHMPQPLNLIEIRLPHIRVCFLNLGAWEFDPVFTFFGEHRAQIKINVLPPLSVIHGEPFRQGRCHIFFSFIALMASRHHAPQRVD